MLTTPWARPDRPEPIPDAVTPEALAAVDDERFARLIRDNLLVRQPDQRPAWERLWAALSADDDLADQTMDVLENFLDTVEDAVRGGGLTEQQAKRAERFAGQCRDAQRRMDRPLAWAGPARRRFNPAAQQVIETLIDAIDTHRSRTGAQAASDADRELWRTLRRVGLDPAAASAPPRRSR